MKRKRCIVCGDEFDFWHSQAKTCGKECSKEYGKRLKRLYKLNNPTKVNESKRRYYLKHKKLTERKPKICKICEKEFIPISSNSKTCSKECRKENTKNNLYRNRKLYLERHPSRRKETSHRYSMKNKELLTEKARIWRKNNPDKTNIIVNRWRKNNKKKRNAQGTAQRNIPFPKDKLCEICNKNKATDRHHENYNKPLEIKFLCSGCHYKEHHKKSLSRGVE